MGSLFFQAPTLRRARSKKMMHLDNCTFVYYFKLSVKKPKEFVWRNVTKHLSWKKPGRNPTTEKNE